MAVDDAAQASCLDESAAETPLTIAVKFGRQLADLHAGCRRLDRLGLIDGGRNRKKDTLEARIADVLTYGLPGVRAQNLRDATILILAAAELARVGQNDEDAPRAIEKLLRQALPHVVRAAGLTERDYPLRRAGLEPAGPV